MIDVSAGPGDGGATDGAATLLLHQPGLQLRLRDLVALKPSAGRDVWHTRRTPALSRRGRHVAVPADIADLGHLGRLYAPFGHLLHLVHVPGILCVAVPLPACGRAVFLTFQVPVNSKRNRDPAPRAGAQDGELRVTGVRRTGHDFQTWRNQFAVWPEPAPPTMPEPKRSSMSGAFFFSLITVSPRLSKRLETSSSRDFASVLP